MYQYFEIFGILQGYMLGLLNFTIVINDIGHNFTLLYVLYIRERREYIVLQKNSV